MVTSVHPSISMMNFVANDNLYEIEMRSLHKTAAESRLRVIESQIALAFTLCAIAETEIRYSQHDQANKVLNKVQHHPETIRFHVNEPNHLPGTAVSGLQNQLIKLKKRIEEIEARLHQP